ncbi:MAG: hypothetical protein ABJN62_03575 [Halioglobus sp.]
MTHIAQFSGKVRFPLRLVLAILTLALTAWIYFPGLSGPALLDDFANVGVIPNVISSPQEGLDYLFGNRSGPLGRPVSMASFLIERQFTDGSVRASKFVNLSLHLLNGCLVYWLLLLLFRHVDASLTSVLAILLSAGWLLSPMYVSTVLYVVQRMAMLAATFGLLALISYCMWRDATRASPVWALFSVIFFLLAVLSKENAIVIVPLILLLEALWYDFTAVGRHSLDKARVAVYAMIIFGLLTIVMLLVLGHEWLVNSFHHRPFTLSERLLTQSRIFWDYLAQLLLPDVSRMGVYHDDIVLSRSIADPIYTLYALVGLALLASICLKMLTYQYGRYFVYAILFFVIGHSVESTVFPLELYFEHRNYLPGVGVFLVLGVAIAAWIKKWPQIKSVLLFYLGAYVVLLAFQTSSQVEVWASEPLFVLDSVKAHPRSFRANTGMATRMASLGDISAARHYSASAHSANQSEPLNDYLLRELALSCAADESVPSQRFELLEMSDNGRFITSVQTLHALVLMLQDDSCPKFDRYGFADRMEHFYLSKSATAGDAPGVFFSLAILENSLQRYDNAYNYIETYTRNNPNDIKGLMMKLHFLVILGKTKERDNLISNLLEYNKAGLLTVAQQRTLDLYLDM